MEETYKQFWQKGADDVLRVALRQCDDPLHSGLKLRHSLKRVASELRNARENANGTD